MFKMFIFIVTLHFTEMVDVQTPSQGPPPIQEFAAKSRSTWGVPRLPGRPHLALGLLYQQVSPEMSIVCRVHIVQLMDVSTDKVLDLSGPSPTLTTSESLILWLRNHYAASES